MREVAFSTGFVLVVFTGQNGERVVPAETFAKAAAQVRCERGTIRRFAWVVPEDTSNATAQEQGEPWLMDGELPHPPVKLS